MKGIEQLGPVPIKHDMLLNLLSDYSAPNNKIISLEASGKLIRLKRGLYVGSPQNNGTLLSPELIANHLLGPSYVSMETALAHYGMIPERVYSVLSLTTKRAKTFDTSLGIFSYIQTSVEYFRIGLFQETVNQQYAFLIASREKALCDKMVYTRQLNLTSQKAVETYLEKDLRIEMQSLKTLDIEIIKQCYETGMKAAQLTHLFKLIKKLK
jgi:predicted transcriptional regulator of viral defense system